MSWKCLDGFKSIGLSLAIFSVLLAPAEAGQGKAKGHQKMRQTTIEVRDSTPGIPTSPRGRGRNYNPGTPRGRYIRTSTTSTTWKSWKSSKRHPRKVRRGHHKS